MKSYLKKIMVVIMIVMMCLGLSPGINWADESMETVDSMDEQQQIAEELLDNDTSSDEQQQIAEELLDNDASPDEQQQMEAEELLNNDTSPDEQQQMEAEELLDNDTSLDEQQQMEAEELLDNDTSLDEQLISDASPDSQIQDTQTVSEVVADNNNPENLTNSASNEVIENPGDDNSIDITTNSIPEINTPLEEQARIENDSENQIPDQNVSSSVTVQTSDGIDAIPSDPVTTSEEPSVEPVENIQFKPSEIVEEEITPVNAGELFTVVSSEVGTGTEKDARLTVNPLESKTLSVIVSTDHPEFVTYQWYDNLNNTILQGENESTLTISSDQWNNLTHSYYCIVTYDDQNGHTASDQVYYTITLDNEFKAWAVGTVNQEMTRTITVDEGQQTELEVGVQGTDTSKVTYYWSRWEKGTDNLWKIKEEFSNHSNKQTTKQIQSNSLYKCNVRDGYGITITIEFYLNVALENGFVNKNGTWGWYQNGVLQTGKTGFQKGIINNTEGDWYVEKGVVDLKRSDVIQGTVDGVTAWWNVKGGKVVSENSVERNSNGWWYIHNGKVEFGYTGFGSNSNGDWYCENGKVNFSKTDVINGTVKGVTAWWNVKGGKVVYEDSVEKNSNGWWYIHNGKVEFIDTVAKNENGWWYIHNGKVDFGYTGFGSNTNGDWYCENGKVNFSRTDVINGTVKGVTSWWNVKGGKVVYEDSVEKNNNGWWYIHNGKVEFINTVAKNDNGWWYIHNGKVDFGFNGIGSNSNGDWYCVNGKVDFSKTDVINITVKGVNAWWNIVGGKVTYADTIAQNSNGWWYIKNGKVDFSYTGFGSNAYGDWYCENGKVIFNKTDVIQGTVKGVNGWWNVVGGKVNYINTVAKNSNGWWYIKNGKVDFNYTGLGTNAGGNWYCVNGKVDFSYSFETSDARSMLSMINSFRTSGDAWYWNEDDSTKTSNLKLNALTYDYELEKVAMLRAAEIAQSFSHTRPNGTICFTAFEELEYPNWPCGENIAGGYLDANRVFIGWREDNQYFSGQGHRRNILSSDAVRVGIGHVISDGIDYWVQEFAY